METLAYTKMLCMLESHEILFISSNSTAFVCNHIVSETVQCTYIWVEKKIAN